MFTVENEWIIIITIAKIRLMAFSYCYTLHLINDQRLFEENQN